MVNNDQATRLLKLKALLDSGAITQEEFERAKKEILAESLLSAGSAIEKPKIKNLRLFGVLGFLSLALPWFLSFASTSDWQGGTISWHLFGYSWFTGYGSNFSSFHFIFSYFEVSSLLSDVLSVIGFIIVLGGSLLLLLRKRVGGILLLADTILWFIIYANSFLSGSAYIAVPIGALLSGVVGVVSIVYKR